MNILHLPTSVGGNAWGLAQGEKALGLDSQVLVKDDTWLAYPHDISLHWNRLSPAAKLVKGFTTWLNVRSRYDVFHFNFGSSLLDFERFRLYLLDLPFYPNDKKIIMTYNGCDARQKYRSIKRFPRSACNESECYNGACNSGERDRIRHTKIRKVARHCDHIFALNPDLLWVLPEGSRFLPYSIAGWDQIEPTPLHTESRLRIVHSPTDRAAKGTSYILQALENLKQRYPIEIILVENVPHEKALSLYAQADLVIDQVLVGWYGGVAVEAMKMGKPVASFVRKEDLGFVPDAMVHDLNEAIINLPADRIEETLAPYLENRSLLASKRQAALDYVHRWHDPVYVASLTKAVYEA